MALSNADAVRLVYSLQPFGIPISCIFPARFRKRLHFMHLLHRVGIEPTTQ